MTRNEFIMQVKDEIKGSCALPYSIPSKEIGRIIDQAKKWFYREYEDATETQFYVIPAKEFQKKQFKGSRSLYLPKCVISVYEFREISGGGRLGSVDPDLSDNRVMAAEIHLAPFQSDDLVMRTAQYSYWDLAQAFFLDKIAYDYNRNTKKIIVKGRNPTKNVFLRTAVEIPEEALFEDWYFIRYVTAQVKIALGRILGFFEYKLVGGVSINSNDIKQEGKDELREIKEDIDGEQTTDWFFVFS